MRYSFQLLPHVNIRYRQASAELALHELEHILSCYAAEPSFTLESIGGCLFLTGDLPPLSASVLHAISMHSSLFLLARREGDALCPLAPLPTDVYPEDLPEVLKYKGKTHVPFTRMLINLARSAARRWDVPESEITVLDPMCGRGTTLYCCLQKGMHSIGLDAHAPSIREGDTYLRRYLEYHRLKFSRDAFSRTVSGQGVPGITYTVGADKEAFRTGHVHSLSFFHADAACASSLLRRHPADLLVCDLPYGVQHDATVQGKPEHTQTMLRRVLPAWKEAMKPDGAGAVSFNRLTLRREALLSLLSASGFTVLSTPPDIFVHEVEQAVQRDILLFTPAHPSSHEQEASI